MLFVVCPMKNHFHQNVDTNMSRLYSAERRLCGFSFRKVGGKKIHEKYMMVFLYAERTPNEPRTNTERTRNDPRTTPERPPKKKIRLSRGFAARDEKKFILAEIGPNLTQPRLRRTWRKKVYFSRNRPKFDLAAASPHATKTWFVLPKLSIFGTVWPSLLNQYNTNKWAAAISFIINHIFIWNEE